MRTSTLILSITTATFATTTGWLAWQLHQRELPAEVVSAVHQARDPARATASAAALEAAAALATQAAPVPAKPAIPPAAAPDDIRPAIPGKRDVEQDPAINFARQFLARFDDSAQRQVQLEEARVGVRRQYGALKEKLGLSKDKFEQVVDLIAQQNLQAQANWARCATDPSCDPKSPVRGAMDDRSQELLALFGAEHIDDFTQYRDTLFERDSVAQFRGRLSDSQFLPQAQAELLITALADERQRYSQEASQLGTQLQALGTTLGMIWYPADAGSIDAQLAGAALYSERMRTRAGTVLTPAQLAAYVQMQEELLAQLAGFIRPPPNKPNKPNRANTLKLAQG